ncbi:hypothetical protein [Nocardioides bruguierae]|uniref:hypothetical protein n=1 Tax=Nocardioides bruguierae TaxID=2945102 RepID=UPI002021154F|nr:hypothetical protein [Nocardioides bruguierae]MCL8026352.1 hypothetical protein [Nocardioides bruguierae]
MNETLQDLMERRLREMGHRRGRGESISLREAYQRVLDARNRDELEAAETGVPLNQAGPPTYEVFRRIRNGHTRITDTTASALATMLDVPLSDVYRAAGIAPRLGRFELPTRADRLDQDQRKVVLSVVDAILKAGEGDAKQPAGDELDKRRKMQRVQTRAARRDDS